MCEVRVAINFNGITFIKFCESQLFEKLKGHITILFFSS
jgi:hypothetical protein